MRNSVATVIGLAIIGIVVFLLAWSNGAFNNMPAARTNANTNVVTSTGAVVPAQATLTGQYGCLDHKDKSGPQTMECAIGLKTADGKAYALDLSALPLSQATSATGTTITVTGLLTPIEMISSAQWQKYDVQGIMKVETLTK